MLALIVSLLAPTVGFAQGSESYEDFLKRGSEAFQRDDLETALLLFTKAQQLHDHPRVRLSLARIHEKLGECAAAKAHYLLLMESESIGAEIRQQAGTGLANLQSCGQPSEEIPVTLPTVAVAPPAPQPKRRDTVRVVSVSMVGGGLTLSVAGALVASGVFLSKATRRCHGLGSSLDDQVGACQELAMTENVEFWEAHVRARNAVETHRLVATTLLTAGLVSTSIGAALLVDARADRKRRMKVGVGPGSVSLALEF